MDLTQLRNLRRTARLTQFEMSLLTGIERTRLSFAECGYIDLTKAEETAIRKAVAKAAQSHAAQVRQMLTVTDSGLREVMQEA